jgi:drug/metabolite transporter (DMT)-like permease
VLLCLGMPFAKLAASEGVRTLAFGFWPTIAAAFALAVIALLRSQAVFSLQVLSFGLVAGSLGYALPMVAAFWVAGSAGAGFASFGFTLPPVFTILLNVAVGREKPRATSFVGVAIGVCAVLLLIADSTRVESIQWRLAAAVFAIPLFIGAGNVYRSIFLPHGVSPYWLGAVTLGCAALIIGCVGLAFGQLAVIRPSTLALQMIAAQAVALTAGYFLYFQLQKRAEPVTFSFLGYFMMTASVAVGVVFLGESLPTTDYVAVPAILVGLWLVSRKTA